MKAVIVRWLKHKSDEVSSEIDELAIAAGYEIIEEFTFYGNSPQPRNFIPNRILDDVQALIESDKIEKIIIDGNIRTHQVVTLEEITEVTVLDKALLVLEIFSNKANSKEIQMQIELAELKYKIPRTVNAVGEAVQTERPGFGGTGTQVKDTLISDINRRMSKLEQKLEDLKKKHLQKVPGNDIPRLPIIGFFSAGKSTLFNILTEGDQEIGQEAFTTMILKAGRTNVTGYPIDLVDTIGIVDLPPHILNAFELMLYQIFSFPGMVLCLDTSNPLFIIDLHLEQFREYFDTFNKISTPRKLLIILTKSDLISSERLDHIISSVSSQPWLPQFEMISISKNDPEKLINDFKVSFEKLFHSDLYHFDFKHVTPRIASKLHESARIDAHGWNSDGTAWMKGVGIRSLIMPFVGDTK